MSSKSEIVQDSKSIGDGEKPDEVPLIPSDEEATGVITTGEHHQLPSSSSSSSLSLSSSSSSSKPPPSSAQLPSEVTVVNLYSMAEEYLVDRLKAMCEVQLRKMLTPRNAPIVS